MSTHEDLCRLVKDIFYEGPQLRSLTTNSLQRILGVDDDDVDRIDLCKQIRKKKLVNKAENYIPVKVYINSTTRKEFGEKPSSEEETPSSEEENSPSEEEEIYTWEDKLTEWENDMPQKYPEVIDSRFFYETSISGPDKPYDGRFIEDERLDKLKYSVNKFKQKIDESQRRFTTWFYTDTGALLLIPIPREGKEYTTMKEFVDTAPKQQQVLFWKEAAKKIRAEWEEGRNVYVSTHGLNVPYFHLRIEEVPRYYVTEEFK